MPCCRVSPDVLSWDIVVWGKTGSDRGEGRGLFGTGPRAEGRGRSHFAVQYIQYALTHTTEGEREGRKQGRVRGTGTSYRLTGLPGDKARNSRPCQLSPVNGATTPPYALPSTTTLGLRTGTDPRGSFPGFGFQGEELRVLCFGGAVEV